VEDSDLLPSNLFLKHKVLNQVRVGALSKVSWKARLGESLRRHRQQKVQCELKQTAMNSGRQAMVGIYYILIVYDS